MKMFIYHITVDCSDSIKRLLTICVYSKRLSSAWIPLQEFLLKEYNVDFNTQRVEFIADPPGTVTLDESDPRCVLISAYALNGPESHRFDAMPVK